MIAEDLYRNVKPEPTKPSRHSLEFAPGVMPFKRQYTHLQQLRVCARGEDVPLRAFDIHLHEVEAFDTGEADRFVPADTRDLRGSIPRGAQRILDRAVVG